MQEAASPQTKKNSKPFVEKTIYRTSKFPEPFFDKDNDVDSLNSFNRGGGKLSRSISSGVSACPNCKYTLDHRSDSAGGHKHHNHKHNHSKRRTSGHHANNGGGGDISWENLGEKIEDWFEYAKTPEQRVVYRFLKDIKDEDRHLDSSLSDRASSAAIADRAQSLEDILDNLKKMPRYRSKFSNSARPANGTGLPVIKSDNNKAAQDPNLNRLFESSTWRVMRHLKSADIRNKYPLPKANPDYHFRNATIFQTVGRPPKSTFLLHPDWV